jgi:hypothetical protein
MTGFWEHSNGQNMLGISWLAEGLSASHEQICSTELVTNNECRRHFVMGEGCLDQRNGVRIQCESASGLPYKQPALTPFAPIPNLSLKFVLVPEPRRVILKQMNNILAYLLIIWSVIVMGCLG